MGVGGAGNGAPHTGAPPASGGSCHRVTAATVAQRALARPRISVAGRRESMEPTGRVRCHGIVTDDGAIEGLALDITSTNSSSTTTTTSTTAISGAVVSASGSGRGDGPAGAEGRDDAAFARLYADQFAPMVRLAVLLVGSAATAEDVVQESFAKLHVRFGRVDQPRAWLRVAVLNGCRNERRRLGRLRHHLARQAGGPEAWAAALPHPEPVDTALLAAVHRLPARQRSVVVLRYYLGLPEAAIAETLGIRPGTVKSRLHRALAQLRREIDVQAGAGKDGVPPCGS